MIACPDCSKSMRQRADGSLRCPACKAVYDLVQRPRELRPVPVPVPTPVPPPPPPPVREPGESEAREVAEHRATLAEIGATDPEERWRLLRARMGARYSVAAAVAAVEREAGS